MIESMQDSYAAPDHVTQMCPSPYGTTYFLTCNGRIFERVRDGRDFNTGPHHKEKWLWREIDGPLAEAPNG